MTAGSHVRHVVIYIPDYRIGGAERAAVNLTQALPAADLRVTLMVNRRIGPLVDAVPPDIRQVSLEASRTLAALPRLVCFLRRERPDVVIASLSFNNLIAIWANRLARHPARIVASVHNTLAMDSARDSVKHRLVPILYAITLPWADRVIAVSQGIADEIAPFLPHGPPTSVIHNPIVSSGMIEQSRAPLDHPWFADRGVPLILGVGRLVAEKNFALLIDAFAHLQRLRPARLAILGDGPLRPNLAARIAALGLDGQATLLPSDPNPWRYMARASVVAMSSDHEGFGNVLVEAMALGVPVVSTDCPHGPAEILGNGRWGILVPSATPESLAQAIMQTMDYPIAGNVLHARAMCFSAAVIAEEYRTVIRRLCCGTIRSGSGR